MAKLYLGLYMIYRGVIATPDYSNIDENQMIITSIRTYEKDHTDGVVYVNGEKFGRSLEDAGRPAGVKIPKETAIPEGAYKVQITFSPYFQRKMIVLYNIDDDHSIDRQGVRFTGIRVHGGNNIEHTAGCLIIAKTVNGKGKASGSLELKLTEIVQIALDDGKEVIWVISEAA